MAIFLIIGSVSFSEYRLIATIWPVCLFTHLNTIPWSSDRDVLVVDEIVTQTDTWDTHVRSYANLS